jgi:hypothetical protein
MRNGFRVPSIIALLILCACTSTRQVADVQFRPPSGNYKLIVIQPDISLGVLTAGGEIEPHEEWTNQARENVIREIVAHQAKRGGDTSISMTLKEAGDDPVRVVELVRLHTAVGESIRFHNYGSRRFRLRSKGNKFDWTLGEQAVAYGAATGYDYALFLHAQGTVSSGGRVAMQVTTTALTCMIAVCDFPEVGQQQTAFASLVDLKTGRIVWFNVVESSAGDFRTAEGARHFVSALLDKMKAPIPRQPARRT